MRKHKLEVASLKVEAFSTITDPTSPTDTAVDQPNGCVCFAPPCVCTAGPDCTQG
jgi:hypothetical protein